MTKRSMVFLGVLALLLLITPAVALGEPPPAYYVDETKLPFGPIPGIETERYWGIHNGAGYRVEVPAAWNGTLVMWAHGFRGSGLELTVDNHPLRPWLVANGYAWAASSYSKNDYDVAQGAKDTHALTKRFNGLVGQPTRTYITGASMGGHITAVLIEQWPNSYDGAMPVCGVLGDHELFDFFLDYNLVAQALAGVQAQFPPPANYLTAVVPPVRQALSGPGPGFPLTLNPAGQNLKAVTILRSGGLRPLSDLAFIVWADFLFSLGALDGTVPRSPGVVVDNSDAVYQFDTNPALTAAEQALNLAVLRVVQQPQGRNPNGLANVPVVSGKITIPVLTLHTIGDLFVPISMEQIYAQRVAAHGASNLLVQRAIRDVGHCSFSPEEFITGFAELVGWVEFGVVPAGDQLTNPAVVANPAFGCNFTFPQRPFAPPCPP